MPDTKEDIARIAEIVAARLAKGEFFEDLFAPDGVIWHNFDETFFPIAQIAQMTAMQKRFAPDLHGEDIRVQVFEGGFLLQENVVGSTLDGAPFRIPGAIVFEVKDGKIARAFEYVTESAAAPLMQSIQKAMSGPMFEKPA